MLKHTVVVGIADAMASAHLRRLILDHPRFELAGMAENAISTLYMVTASKPAVVLLADDSPGIRGRDVLAEMAVASPSSLVIITTPGEPEALIGRPGVAEAVPQADIDAIVKALNNLADFLDHPQSTDRPERRGQGDRRMIQDWTKVFAERRTHPRRVSS